MFDRRRRVEQERNLLSSHGEASRFFVTFLDCHDDDNRVLYPPAAGDLTDQLTLGLACLFTLPHAFHGRDGSVASGWARRVPVVLAPMEIQVLAPAG